MKCIVKIGSYQFLLPDDSGVAAVLKTLSRGVPCYEKLYCGAVELRSEDGHRAIELSMLYVPEKTKFHAEDSTTPVPTPFAKASAKPKQLKNTVLRLMP